MLKSLFPRQGTGAFCNFPAERTTDKIYFCGKLWEIYPFEIEHKFVLTSRGVNTLVAPSNAIEKPIVKITDAEIITVRLKQMEILKIGNLIKYQPAPVD